MAGKGSLKGFEFGVPSMQGLAHKENYVNMEPPPPVEVFASLSLGTEAKYTL